MSLTQHFLPVRLRAYMRHPRVRAAWLSFFWGVVLFYFLFCALVLTTRWILLPQVDRYKDEIAGFLSDKLHAEVSIGSVSPRWDTFWPQLSMDNVVIRRPDPRTSDEHVLHLPQVYASFYWRSILGQPIFRRLEVTDAEITVRRVGENVFDLAGFVFDFDRSAGEGGGGGLEWLLKQGRIDLVNTRLTYSDLIAQPRPRHTSLENINLSFAQEGGEYKAGIQGNLRSLHDNRIDVRVRFTTPLFGERTWDTWTGELFVAADNLDIARLARPIPSARKLIGSGRGSTRTWLTFDEGKPKELTSYLGMSDVVLRFTEEAEPLRVKTLSTLLTETFENDVISAKAENLAFELPDGTSARDLELTSTVALTDAASPDSPRSGFTIRHLDVGTLEKLLPSVPFPKEAAELIAEHHAGGNITDFELTWSGKPREARDWRIRAGFENLSLANAAGAQNMFSGFENLTGSLEITRESGHIAFDTRSGAVSLPGVFENARVPLDELTGTVSWNRAVDPTLSKPVVTVSFDNVAVSNEDAAVTLKGLWRQNDTKAGYIDISGNLLRGKAESAWRYIPLKIHQNVRNWLQGGLVAGTATDGNYVLKGDLVHYPWTGEYKDKGLFRVEAKLTGGAIDYVPSLRVLPGGEFERATQWPLLTDINGRLLFEGSSMVVTAESAVTGGAKVTQARAEIPNLAGHENTRLLVVCKAQADMQKFFDYVEASPITGYLSGAFAGTKAKGLGHLDLSLDIPLLHAKDTKVDGAISLEDADVTMAWPRPPLTDVEGTVHFSEKGARASNVHARAFGTGDASVSVHTTKEGAIVISAAGSADASHIGWFANNAYADTVLENLSGTLPYVVTVMIKKGSGVSVSARSTLKGVTVDLPSPLYKAPDTVWDTTFAFTPITVRGQKGYQIRTGSGARFDVLLQLPADNSKLPVRGAVAVGAAAKLPAEGVAISAQAKSLRLMDWSTLIQTLMAQAKKEGAGTKTESGSGAGLTSVEVKADELILEDGTIHKSRSLLGFDGAGNVDITVDSDEIAGRLRYESADRGNVTGSFERLYLSAKAPDTLKRFLQGESVDVVLQPRPTVLPSLDLVAEDLRYDNRRIGRMVLQAQASGTADKETLSITNFAVFTDDSALTGRGFWTQGRTLTGTQPGSTDFELTFTSKNLGRALTDLGFEGVIHNASGTASGHVTFEGVPWSPKLETLAGTYKIDFRKGSFAKVDTGAGGLLLSFLSMQTIFKRLTLDFSDFQGGFAFDSFTGSSTIKDGILSNDNTKIVGTHGTILLSGNLNLPKGEIDSRLIVLPDINAGNASLALAFVNPAVGIGTFLAQLLLRTPLSHLFKVEYTIKGPWAEPVITKVSSDQESPESD